jgi:hypothetical protein
MRTPHLASREAEGMHGIKAPTKIFVSGWDGVRDHAAQRAPVRICLILLVVVVVEQRAEGPCWLCCIRNWRGVLQVRQSWIDPSSKDTALAGIASWTLCKGKTVERDARWRRIYD